MTSTLPAVTMMWTLTDEVIENRDELQRQFEDIRSAGFGGVAAFVRCSRYRWDRPAAIDACQYIGRLCRRYNLHFWVVPDPRFISRELVNSSEALPLLLFGDSVRADRVPHFAFVENNRFSVRCELQPRHSHMVHEVAITFNPGGLAAVYAVPDGTDCFSAREVLEITKDSLFFYNAHGGYMEAFGCFQPPDERRWKVIAFFRVNACHFNFSDPIHMQVYLEKLDLFARSIEKADMLMWDEPGYTCIYGALPFSFGLQKEYEQAGAGALTDHLWKLALKSKDSSHVEVRNRFFSIVQNSVIQAQKRAWDKAISIWGPETLSGVHDTWHFESADMADMNHGSMNLWKALESKNGGFVDMGAINYLISASSGYYANLASMVVICKSLGVFSRDKFAFNNLWTIGEDETPGEQEAVMDHCVNAMALFGNRWFAHIYGPVGTIGQEQQFLGSPRMPGYPHHSTWSGFPLWNQRLKAHLEAVEHKLPFSNVLLVFPCETLYAMAGPEANKAASRIFNFILFLIDHHYHVDIVSADLLLQGAWQGNGFLLQDNRYDALLFPYPQIMQAGVCDLISDNKAHALTVFAKPQNSSQNQKLSFVTTDHAPDEKAALRWLGSFDYLRPVDAPGNSWVTLTELSDRSVISLMPARNGRHYGGCLRYKQQCIDLEEQTGLCRIFLFRQGKTVIEPRQTLG